MIRLAWLAERMSISRSDASMLSIVLLALLGVFSVAWVFAITLSLQRITALTQDNFAAWQEIDRQVGFIMNWSETKGNSVTSLKKSQEQVRSKLEAEAITRQTLNQMIDELGTFPYSLMISDRNFEDLKSAKIDSTLWARVMEASRAPEAIVRNRFMHWNFATDWNIRSGYFMEPLKIRGRILGAIQARAISYLVSLLGVIAVVLLVGIITVWFRFLRPSIKAREEAQAELEVIFDNIPGFVVSIDADMRLISANRAYLEARGIGPDAIANNILIEDTVESEVWQKFRPRLEQAFAGEIAQFDAQIDVHGKSRTVHATYVPVRDRAGMIDRVTALIVDIHERFVAEQALRESEENLQITLNSIGDGVISTNIDGKILRMNPVACALTGWDQDSALGKPLSDVFQIINGSTKELVEDPVQTVLRTGVTVGPASGTVLAAKDKTEYIIAISAAPIHNSQGDQTGVVLIFRDVTSEHFFSQRLVQDEKMRALGQLAGGIAHDFNNALAGILGAAELILMDRENDISSKSEMMIKQITKSAVRASKLTEKLTTFSRASPTELHPVNIANAIVDSINIVENSIDKRVEIHNNCHVSNPDVFGNKSQLSTAILNVLLNATQSMKEGGQVVITSENKELNQEFCDSVKFDIEPGPYLVVSVQDSGHGIPEGNIERVFEPFFTTKAIDEGTGLGLSEVYGAITDHHGAVIVESQVNVGTTFTLLFPSYEPGAYVVDNQEDVEVADMTALRILFVDDEPLLREIGEITLESLGHSSILAADGHEAIRLYTENSGEIDLVILDLNMPGLGGAEVLKQLIKIDSDVQVIIATGFGNDLEMPEETSLNVIARLKKPYRLHDLQSVLALHHKKR